MYFNSRKKGAILEGHSYFWKNNRARNQNHLDAGYKSISSSKMNVKKWFHELHCGTSVFNDSCRGAPKLVTTGDFVSKIQNFVLKYVNKLR